MRLGRIIDYLHRSRIHVKGGCWNTRLITQDEGYPLVYYAGELHYAHRISAAYYLGLDLNDSSKKPIHTCRNRGCWNPEHLKIVSNEPEALQLLYSKPRTKPLSTHCRVCGLEYDIENTLFIKGKRGPYRQCRNCKLNNLRNWQRRHK